MASIKRIDSTGSALRREALLGLSMLALLAMALAGMALWPTAADAGEPAGPVWSADMTVVEYSSVSIGAASADLFSNIGGSGNLQIKSLWSYIPGRDLRLAFDDGVPNAADYTLRVGDLSLEFPEGSSGQNGFTWSDVDVDWEDGQIVQVRIVATSEINTTPQANNPASGLPTISGRAQVGQTLTADTSGIGDADGLASVSYTYQWLADDTGIDGATSSTYTLQSSDNGKAIKVRVNFTDDAGNAESLTSAGTSAVATKANIPASGLPAISGTARVGYTLAADTSGIADADGLSRFPYAYQWIRSNGGADADIADATESTYALTDDDAGKTVKVRVTFNDDKGNGETLTSAATAEVGESQETPQFLVSNLGAGVGGSGGIQRTLGAARSGFAQAFTTGAKDGGYPLGSVGIQISNFYDTSAVADHLRVTINGASGEGGPGDAHCTLTNPSSFPAPGVSAFGAPTGAGSCPLLAAETTYFVVIEWVNPSEAGSFAIIPQTYPTAVSAATAEDQGGAAGWSIADQSHYLTVSSNVRTWTAYDETASFKIKVKGLNNPATGLPTISGTAQVGETLTADTSAIADEDGLSSVTYSYQWIAGEAVILGARGSTYQITSQEQGLAIHVWVSFRDDAGNVEALTSAGTLPVEPRQNNPAAGAPTILGTARVGKTLTADTSGISDADGLDNVVYGYQWLADDGDIQGATNSSYDLTDEELGKAIKVKVTFTDDKTSQETLTSGATAAVAEAGGPLTGFTLLDASNQAVLATPEDREEVSLDDPSGGNYAIRADVESGSDIGSVHLELSGAKGVSRTENVAPYSLYGDGGADALTGGTLPAGSYDLEATAYSEKNRGGDELGSLSVSFVVTETALTAAFQDVPDAHNGTASFSFWIEFSEPVATSYLTLADSALTVTGGAVTSASRVDGRSDLWKIIVKPDDSNAVSVTLPATTDCDDQGAVCTATGKKLSSGDRLFVPGPLTAENNPATGAPTISGTAQADQTLTAGTSGIADVDGLTNVEYGYQWLADEAEISGATNSTYDLTGDEVGKAIKVKVTFTDDEGNEETLTSAATPTVTAATNNLATGAPTISGTAQAGQTLTASTDDIADADGLTNVEYGYQWLADDTDILGATGSTYNLTDDQVGKTVKVKVSFTDDAGNDETLTSAGTSTVAAAANSPATGLPSISGTAQAGQTLTAGTSGIADADGLTNVEYGYQWLADDTDILGATGSTYNLTDDEVGKAIKVRVAFTDDANNEESLTSVATTTITAAANNPATGLPGISGTAQAGKTLTAGTDDIADADGLTNVSYSYQWLADDTEISGATSSTYTLTDDEVGKTIKVKVTFTDDAGNDESLTNAATATVTAAANSPATGAPSISGTAQAGQTLTAGTSGIGDTDGLTNVSYSYQWLADGADISGATSSTYDLTDDEVGKTIKVKVTFTDDAGNDESLTSAATGTVAAAPAPLTVSLENKPTSHDGTNDFSFDIRFSEEPHADFSFKTLKFHAFNVSGGTVQKAQRLQKEPESNIGWRITVRPDGNGDVTVVLPVTTDCSAAGAICTGDGRKLSNRLEFTVPGPSG